MIACKLDISLSSKDTDTGKDYVKKNLKCPCIQEVQITSMLIVNQHKVKTNKFTCSVQHDSIFDDQSVVFPRQENKAVICSYVFSECPPLSIWT